MRRPLRDVHVAQRHDVTRSWLCGADGLRCRPRARLATPRALHPRPRACDKRIRIRHLTPWHGWQGSAFARGSLDCREALQSRRLSERARTGVPICHAEGRGFESHHPLRHGARSAVSAFGSCPTHAPNRRAQSAESAADSGRDLPCARSCDRVRIPPGSAGRSVPSRNAKSCGTGAAGLGRVRGAVFQMTSVRRRIARNTLWALCTAIPIQALRYRFVGYAVVNISRSVPGIAHGTCRW
jgi:hypothetical protein